MSHSSPPRRRRQKLSLRGLSATVKDDGGGRRSGQPALRRRDLRPHPGLPGAGPRPRAGLRGVARRRTPRRRLPDRLPDPEPAARPVRRRRAVGGLRSDLRADAAGRRPARRAHRLASRAAHAARWRCSLGPGAARVSSLAGPLVGCLAPGFDAVPGKGELTVLLTRVMLPFLPLVSFAAVAMGMLNAEERYGAAGASRPRCSTSWRSPGARCCGRSGSAPNQVVARLGDRHAARRRGAVPDPGPAAAATGLALPAGMGAGRPRHPRASAR